MSQNPVADLPVRHTGAPPPGSILPSHFEYCFGCGSDHPSGLHLQIVVGEALDLTGEFIVAAEHQGAAGLVHGGVLAAAFDEVLGALNWLLLKPAVTGRLEVDFRKPVPVGSRITIAARIAGVDGRKVDCIGIGRFDDGRVAAEARGLFIQVPLAHFAEHGDGAVPGAAAMESRMELNP